MKFWTQVVAGEYIQRLCEVPQDTNQTKFSHQKTPNDSTGHGNPAFYRRCLGQDLTPRRTWTTTILPKVQLSAFGSVDIGFVQR